MAQESEKWGVKVRPMSNIGSFKAENDARCDGKIPNIHSSSNASGVIML